MSVMAAIIITIIIAYSINPIIPIIAITRSLSARSPIPIPCKFTPRDSAFDRVKLTSSENVIAKNTKYGSAKPPTNIPRNIATSAILSNTESRKPPDLVIF